MTAKLQLSNSCGPSLPPIELAALADTGSVFLCIPEHVRLQLINPRDRTVDVNPDSPNIATGICKRAA